MSVSLREITKVYRGGGTDGEATRALDDVTCDARAAELLVVVGPSGSGKTTLLRCVAGLEHPDAGSIEVAGEDVTERPPAQRDLGMVFQDHALFPHLTVEGNVAFGLVARKVPAAEWRAAVASTLELLGLTRLRTRLPRELSGGERQRVALGRAIVRRPKVFLMDEPLASLDVGLRSGTRKDLLRLQRHLQTTTIYVTHDQVEAMTMADRVAVLANGRIEQVGAPVDVYDHPANVFVARFFGTPPMNLWGGSLAGRLGAAMVGLRAEHLHLVPADDAAVVGRVDLVEILGADAVVHVRHQEGPAVVKLARNAAPEEGAEVGIDFDVERVHRFDREGRAIR